MTEAEWLARTNPHKMLDFLRDNVSARKLWLFVSVSAREIRPFFQGLSNEPVDTADLWERYADGQVSELNVKRAFRARMNLSLEPPLSPPWQAARSGVFEVMFWFMPRGATEYPRLCEIIRDVFGNPLRPITVDPACLTPAVVKLAEAIYEDRAFDRLPILADALEEAGCTDAAILSHCRSEGPHVRGCWVVDMLLGKE
jgi:hypothetical protein